MNKITNWFKGYFGTKDDEDETFEVEEEQGKSSRSRTDFSRPLILDEDELEAYGVAYDEPTPVTSNRVVKAPKKEVEEIIYHSSEIISPFHGLKKDESEKKERPKAKPSSQKKDQTIISPYFGAVKKAEEPEQKPVEEVKTNTQEIKLNIRFDEDEYPETFDELRDWYKEDDEK